MTDTFRALCAELVAAWDSYDYADAADATDRMNEAVKDAKAALAQPEPVPTDEAWFADFSEWLKQGMPEGTVIGDPMWWASSIADYLARWGRPTIKPTPEATDG